MYAFSAHLHFAQLFASVLVTHNHILHPWSLQTKVQT